METKGGLSDGFSVGRAWKGIAGDFGFAILECGFNPLLGGVQGRVMSAYVFFIVLWKYLHADVRRAAKFYRMVFLAALIAFAAFMWTLDIKLIMDS